METNNVGSFISAMESLGWIYDFGQIHRMWANVNGQTVFVYVQEFFELYSDWNRDSKNVLTPKKRFDDLERIKRSRAK